MNNQDNNKAKKICLNEKQEIEKNKLMLQMENEIKQLEFQLKYSKIKNLKIKMIRKLKIPLKMGQQIVPYVLVAGITFGGFAIFGKTPFIEDEYKKKFETKKEIDSLGNKTYEQQYSENNNFVGSISYIGKWEEQTDGFYSRNIKTYSTNKVNEDIITRIVDDNDITSLDEIFGRPTSSKIETKNNLTKEELDSKEYLQAVIYSISDDDFIIIREDAETNLYSTIAWIASTLFLGFGVSLFSTATPFFDYKYYIERINEKYPLVDADELRKKLEIKQSNYNRLKG